MEAAAGGIAGPVWACGIGMLGPAAAGPASLTASLRQDGMYEKIEDDALLAAWFFAHGAQKLFQAHLRVLEGVCARFALSSALTSPRPLTGQL